MRITIVVAGLALLAGCNKADSGPTKRQPGSWSQKITVDEFTGPGITEAQRNQMQQMMTMASAMTVCITPELAAAEDIEKNLTNMGGQAGNCVVADKTLTASKIAFTANCKDKGKDIRIVADGTNGATEQDIKMTVESAGASNDGGKLVMRIAAKRQGECKPGEFTPKPAPAAPAKTAS